MNELLYCEEMLWMQRYRIAWLHEEDHNTCFFTGRRSGGHGKKRIKALVDDTGVMHKVNESRAAMATPYLSMPPLKSWWNYCDHQEIFITELSVNRDLSSIGPCIMGSSWNAKSSLPISRYSQ